MNETYAGVAAIVIVQIVVVVTLWLNGRNARLAQKALADQIQAKEVRDREWLVEDREALASDMARKVGHQAEMVASSVASSAFALAEQAKADHARMSAEGREAVADIAAKVTAQQRNLADQVAEEARVAAVSRGRLAAALTENTAQTVDVATKLAENTGITLDVGAKADAALQAAMSVTRKIDRLNQVAQERAARLSTEGAAHLAEAERITIALGDPGAVPELETP